MEKELSQLIKLAYKLPENSVERLAALEGAVRLSDQLGDLKSSFRIRTDVVREAVFSGQFIKALPAFAWCLGVAKKDEEFSVHDILWEYKWICSNIANFYEIPLYQIEEMFEDFRKELKNNGYSEYAYWYMQLNLGHDLRDEDMAKKAMSNIVKHKRDGMCDCRACELDGFVHYYIFIGDLKQALSKARPILEKRMSCAEVPHMTYANLLLPVYFSGDAELAKDFALKGYRLIDKNPEFLSSIGCYLQYYALIGNSSVLKKYSKFAEWSLSSFNRPACKFSFSVHAAAMFKTLLNRGKDNEKMLLLKNHPLYNPEGVYELKDFYSYHYDIAKSLADKFDKRNQNNGYNKELEFYLSKTS